MFHHDGTLIARHPHVASMIGQKLANAPLVERVRANGGVQTLPPPSVGWPAFLALSIVYFAMNYLLLGAAFLTIGAQASTAREVQTMSMPVTFHPWEARNTALRRCRSPSLRC